MGMGTGGLSPDEQAMVDTIHRFVDTEVRPVAREYEHADRYPAEFIEQMKQIGLFGLTIPEEYGGTRVSVPCFALVTEELARGWMSLAGAIGGHAVVSTLIGKFGTEAQREKFLPPMATGELRATMALTEPQGGSDLQAIRTTALLRDGRYVVNGSKTWITNAQRAGMIALLCKTDPEADPAYEGISVLLVEKGPGLSVGAGLPKLGYRGVESCEVFFDDCEVPTSALLGEVEGQGFRQMMNGLEIGRIQVAARALGVARAAFEDALAYAQERETFGKPIWRHQSVGNMLADMGTKLRAARLLVLDAAQALEEGRRCDMEAGMAKLFASEVCLEITTDALRIHGGYGYSKEFDIERYYRDAPLMVVGEGTNEIQRNVIVRQLVARGGLF